MTTHSSTHDLPKIRCSVGVTAYNEETNIGPLLAALSDQHLHEVEIVEIIVVASACTDRTVPIVREQMALDPRITLIEQERREGKTSAINLFLQAAQSDICVLESGDTLPHEYAVEHMVRMFRDPQVGMVGAQKVAVNTPDHIVGLLSHLRLRMEHELCLEIPRLGEMIAFRKVFDRIPPDVAMDEAFVEALVVRKGMNVRYAPDAIVYNTGPTTVGDFVRQRRRNHAGHLYLKHKYGYAVSSMDNSRVARIAVKELWGIARLVWVIFLLGAIEGWSRIMGWYDFAIKRERHVVWNMAWTQKQNVHDVRNNRNGAKESFAVNTHADGAMTKSRIVDLLKLAVALALLVWLFMRLPDPAALWQQILDANKMLLLLGALCYTAAVALSGLKWGVLLRAAGIQVPSTRLLSYQWMAEFFNNFLPAQVGGDVMRGYAVAVDTRRKADATASVLIDRFIGLIVFMLFAALASSAMLIWGKPNGEEFTTEGLIFMRFAAVGSIIFTVALGSSIAALLSRRLKRLVERLLALLPFSARTLPIWTKLAVAFDVYRDHPSALAITALGSAAIVVLTSVNIWLISWAVQPGSISLLEVLAINPIIVFALLVVPLSPGGLGVRQVSFAGLFLFIGAGAALGTAVGLLQQFIGYLVSLPGGYFWVRSGSTRPTTPDVV